MDPIKAMAYYNPLKGTEHHPENSNKRYVAPTLGFFSAGKNQASSQSDELFLVSVSIHYSEQLSNVLLDPRCPGNVGKKQEKEGAQGEFTHCLIHNCECFGKVK